MRKLTEVPSDLPTKNIKLDLGLNGISELGVDKTKPYAAVGPRVQQDYLY